MVRNWPFVGRAAQLARVRRIRSGPGARAGVVLVGPAGSGLTRLARAVLDAAAAEGWTARWVMATRSASEIPLGALAQVLVGAEPDGPQVLTQVAGHLVAGTNGRGLIVGVNDAHLLDPVSASVLHHLAVTRSAFLVLAAHTEVAVPDPVFALWKENLLERVDLHEFDEDETAELLGRVVEGQVGRATVHRLHALTGGNATYLREFVEEGLRSRALSPVDGVWRWVGPLCPTRRLSDLVRARIGPLLPEEQEALELLAFGRDLDADGLLHRYGADLLDRLEQRGLLVSRAVGDRVRVAPAHPLDVEVLRSATSPLRERAVYRLLADTFDGPDLEAVDRIRATSWRLAGGLPVASETLVAVTRQAAEVAEPDPAAAVRVARAAVGRGAGSDASLVLAQALSALGRPAEAEEVLAGLAEVLAATDGDARRLGLAVIRLGNLRWGVGSPDRAAELAAEIDRTCRTDARRPELLVLRAAGLAYAGRYGEALAAVAPLLDDAERLGPLAGPARAVAAEAWCGTGRHEAALTVAGQGRAALSAAASWAAGWGLPHLDSASCGALIGLGRLPEAAALAEAGHRRAVGAGQPVAQALYGGWHGIVLARQGRLAAAVERLHDAAGAVRDGAFPFLALVRAQIAEAEAMRGDSVAAAAALRNAERAAEAVGGAGDAWVALASAWTAAAQGGDAVSRALDAARRARAVSQLQVELQALHGCVRLDAAEAALERITEVAARVDGPIAPAYARHAQALAAGDARALGEVADVFARHGMLLLAAEVAAQAARLHELAGRKGASRLTATRARQWAGRCEGATTPPLASLGAAEVLTSRESEIATLAAAGMTSKAIAAQLMVSVRTVDNVLHGIYRKLGVPGRRELGVALRAGVGG
ncbi:LuxR C-terminal-related transcriptional regulator [Pseudonocardia sp. RS11V-5]|uniref:helix-turn-helix transcriptional regulator n=1 Tax=Pseudonocardia terrae TaxID=2905831 RepID=UPI001E56453E|nr:LuxR family transcriptional regulator [Pseudonocardia terrae]MCE3554323.1 LuxR C-terminal-related transcriptional regulator [Pseudonocardia terrae]